MSYVLCVAAGMLLGVALPTLTDAYRRAACPPAPAPEPDVQSEMDAVRAELRAARRKKLAVGQHRRDVTARLGELTRCELDDVSNEHKARLDALFDELRRLRGALLEQEDGIDAVIGRLLIRLVALERRAVEEEALEFVPALNPRRRDRQ